MASIESQKTDRARGERERLEMSKKSLKVAEESQKQRVPQMAILSEEKGKQ